MAEYVISHVYVAASELRLDDEKVRAHAASAPNTRSIALSIPRSTTSSNFSNVILPPCGQWQKYLLLTCHAMIAAYSRSSFARSPTVRRLEASSLMRASISISSFTLPSSYSCDKLLSQYTCRQLFRRWPSSGTGRLPELLRKTGARTSKRRDRIC